MRFFKVLFYSAIVLIAASIVLSAITFLTNQRAFYR